MSLLLTLNRFHKLFKCFYDWLWTSKCRLGTFKKFLLMWKQDSLKPIIQHYLALDFPIFWNRLIMKNDHKGWEIYKTCFFIISKKASLLHFEALEQQLITLTKLLSHWLKDETTDKKGMSQNLRSLAVISQNTCQAILFDLFL